MRHVYKICEDWDDIYTLVGYIKKTGMCSHDFETLSDDKLDKYGGLKYYSAFSYPTIIGISFQPGSAWIIPLAHKESPFKDEYEDILKYLGREIFSNPEITKVSWNTKYEYKWLLRYGVTLTGRCFDGMLAKHLLDEERPHGLKEMVARFLPEFAGYGIKNFGCDLETLSEYCSLDADLTLRLFLFFEKKLMTKGFYPLFRNLFTPLTSVLGKSEFYGIGVDRAYLKTLVIKYDNLIEEQDAKLREIPLVAKYERYRLQEKKQQLIDALEDEIDALEDAGKAHLVAFRKLKIKQYSTNQFLTKSDLKEMAPINFGSPQQMASLFYTSKRGFKFPIIERTESGAPSTAEDVLLKLKAYDTVGFIDALLELRGLEKLQSTYIRGVLNILGNDDLIHSNYKIHGTVTGRLCVSRDCLIHIKGGTIKIGDLVPPSPGVIPIEGIEVLTHTGIYRPILKAINKGVEEMFEVTLNNGFKIKCTAEHQFLTSSGWLALKDITHEDIIYWNPGKDICGRR